MYLQDDILTKVDRATMSVSLEGREPLLDHRLIEYAAQLPLEYKYDGSITKKILKDIVYQYVPKEMLDRPKKGFTLPIYTWLRKDLQFLLGDYFNEAFLKSQDMFNTVEVLRIISLFKQNKFHYQPLVWKLLMFQMWYKKWM
jgi:asparagine synthase (glutamine-hydrolysing)